MTNPSQCHRFVIPKSTLMPTTNLNPSASRPDALQDFLSTPPTWLLHSGMGLMCTFGVFVLLMSWFISFPDRIQATALLHTQQAPVEIVCVNGGRLESIVVPNQHQVRSGQILGLLQTSAYWRDLQWVEKIMSKPLNTDIVLPSHPLQLGDVQTSFASWLQVRLALQAFLNQTITQEQITTLQKEAQFNTQLAQALDQRSTLYGEEVELVQRDYNRAIHLNDQNVISDQELEGKKTAWLQARRSEHSMREEAIQNRIRAEQLHTEQLRLYSERQNSLEEHQRNYQQATQQLQASLAQWKLQFLITAPIAGTVVWQTGLSEGQFLNAGKVSGTIIPSSSEGIIAICTTPTAGSGRMRLGNRVQIELDAFPADEFGYLNGRVCYISRLPDTDQEGKFFYQVEVKLPDTLRSSYGKTIPFRQNLSGTARIVTKERRVLERLLGKMWQITNFSNEE